MYHASYAGVAAHKRACLVYKSGPAKAYYNYQIFPRRIATIILVSSYCTNIHHHSFWAMSETYHAVTHIPYIRDKQWTVHDMQQIIIVHGI
jgi:hypothetical protein